MMYIYGKGYNKARVVIWIHDSVILELQWSKSEIVINPKEKESAVTKKPIPISGQDVRQNEVTIDYDVFLEPLTFNLDDFCVKVKHRAIRLTPRNKPKLKEIYDPLTVEEMKKLGLANITD